MNYDDLKKLLQQGESQTLEWKRDWPRWLQGGLRDANWNDGKGELLKDLCSMANGLEEDTAYVVYGVQDHDSRREVIGISRTWDDADFQTWNSNGVDPPLIFVYYEVRCESDKVVGIFQLVVAEQWPHVAKETLGDFHEGQVWRRRGTQNRVVASHQELEALFLGPEPMSTDNVRGSIVNRTVDHYRGLGREVVWVRYFQRDDKLAEGYRPAVFPETRRQVVFAASHLPQPDSILMVKPRDKG